MLLRRGANPNFEHVIVFEGDLFRTTPLGLASGHGHAEAMRVLLKSSANIKFPLGVDGFIPHLVPAVSNCHVESVRLLLSAGAHIEAANNFRLKSDNRETTLIERAQVQQGMSIYRMLFDAGDSVSSFAMQNFLSLQVMWHWKHKNSNELLEVLALAKQSGLFINGIECDSVERFLQSMLQKNSCDVPRLLRLAGAPVSGRQAPLNLDIPTVTLLDHLGVLSSILSTNGHMILINAILAEDENLMLRFTERIWILQMFSSNAGLLCHQSELSTIVWQACVTSDVSLVQELIGTLKSRFSAPTAMAIAVRAKKDALMYLLLEAGFSPKGLVTWPSSNIIPEEVEDTTDWWNLPTAMPQSSLLEVLTKIGNFSLLKAVLEKAPWTPIEIGCALLASIRCNNMQIVVYLLNAGVAISNDAVIAAIELQDISLVRRLIATGINLNTSSDDLDWTYTPLQQAVKSNNMDLVKLILEAGADVNEPPAPVNGATALQLATKSGNMDLTKIILEAGADPNDKPAGINGADALQIAATNGFIGIARQLLDQGATIYKPNLGDDHKSALVLAAENGRLDMIQLLVFEGNVAQGPLQRQVIRAVAAAEERGHYSAARFLKGKVQWQNLHTGIVSSNVPAKMVQSGGH
ncbi:hypothetical protein N7478_013104 [Penicillium angulare]|uniref:uncharacterized protein n=1 Tax=Penicillium angulare TaxID=116970 RepID=UPI0025408248|nr:uncharacterized protein N7478_013104 [Penicillium angulare]KAJ5257000.1 hypothetical protein N7478_013104 [Penicillium angulare]